MRAALNRLYAGAGMAAGACIVMICLIILIQIAGRWFGIIVPSTEDFSGFLLAAATFLALAYTFRHGGHIRVTLLIHLLAPRNQRWLTLLTLLVFTVIVAWGAWQLCYLVYESWYFEELSQGYIAVPMWIPQLPMALGAVVFCIALLDDLVSFLLGSTPLFLAREE